MWSCACDGGRHTEGIDRVYDVPVNEILLCVCQRLPDDFGKLNEMCWVHVC